MLLSTVNSLFYLIMQSRSFFFFLLNCKNIKSPTRIAIVLVLNSYIIYSETLKSAKAAYRYIFLADIKCSRLIWNLQY